MSVLCYLNLCFAAFALIPFLPIKHWSIRFFDFPRMQFLVLQSLLIGLNLVFYQAEFSLQASLILLVISTTYQLKKISKYTILYPTEVRKSKLNLPEQEISIMVSNVLMTNTNILALISELRSQNPDLLFCLETNKRWENELADATQAYPYQIKVPQDNLYGMHLYSKLKLSQTEVRYLVEDKIPSIRCRIRLKSGQEIQFYGLHPKPPSPTENKSSVERDAELLMVAKEIKDLDIPCIVCGDLNDVAWSKSTELFKTISGLLDSRIGRGRYSTFHADSKLMRWPLDHFFHSSEFMLKELNVLGPIYSDHFPIFTRLQFQENAQEVHEASTPDQDDLEEANEHIKQAKVSLDS